MRRVKINLSSFNRRLLFESLLALLGSLIVLVLVWIVACHSLRIPFGISQLGYLHSYKPELYFVDALPILIAAGWYIAMRGLRLRAAKLESALESNRAAMERNAEFALAIGNGDYDAHFSEGGGTTRLGESLLQMRLNLKKNSEKEAENDWITKGKDEVGYILRLHTNLDELGYAVLQALTKYIDVVQGGLYLWNAEEGCLDGLAAYAYGRDKLNRAKFRLGEGLVGQCAYERAPVYRTEIPADYVTISSGILGDQKPRSLLLVPLITDDKLQGVLEFASIREEFRSQERRFLREIGETIARTVFNLMVNTRTEHLLREAQQMTQELRENEEQLRQNAEEMQVTHEELERSNAQLETKIQEAENAQKRLHSLLENASEVIMIYNRNQEITYISPSVSMILGYTQREMMDGKDQERLTQKGISDLNRMFKQLLAQPMVPVTMQYVFMRKDGVKVLMEVTGRNLLDDPAIEGIILNSQDITERQRAEKEERMKSKMQSLSENSLDMIIRLDVAGIFFYVNPAASRYLGLPVESLLNHRLGDVALPGVLLEAFSEALIDIREHQGKWEKEVTLGKDQDAHILRFMGIPEIAEGQLETILLVGHDVTEAKRIEFEIQDKSRKITESINYAQRIQSSILPDTKLIQQYLPKSFMIYWPRDVVSGDFPWFFRKDDYIYIAAVDCTGHGVPGALLSFIGFFTLNNVVDHDASYSAGQVLDYLHSGVRRTLRQDRPDADARDGMDIALCKVDLAKLELQFAGAHRPLYHMRGTELTEYKGDRKAIGGIPSARGKEGDFTNYQVQLKEGDRIFFFSDGLTDQLGGESGMKKFSPQRVRELIALGKDLSMPRLSQRIAEEFKSHMGNGKQIDDVLLIGIEF